MQFAVIIITTLRNNFLILSSEPKLKFNIKLQTDNKRHIVPKDQIERVFHTHENAACVERSVRQKVGYIFRPTNHGNGTVIIRGSNCVIEPEKCGVPANKVNIGNYKNLKHRFL